MVLVFGKCWSKCAVGFLRAALLRIYSNFPGDVCIVEAFRCNPADPAPYQNYLQDVEARGELGVKLVPREFGEGARGSVITCTSQLSAGLEDHQTINSILYPTLRSPAEKSLLIVRAILTACSIIAIGIAAANHTK